MSIFIRTSIGSRSKGIDCAYKSVITVVVFIVTDSREWNRVVSFGLMIQTIAFPPEMNLYISTLYDASLNTSALTPQFKMDKNYSNSTVVEDDLNQNCLMD